MYFILECISSHGSLTVYWWNSTILNLLEYLSIWFCCLKKKYTFNRQCLKALKDIGQQELLYPCYKNFTFHLNIKLDFDILIYFVILIPILWLFLLNVLDVPKALMFIRHIPGHLHKRWYFFFGPVQLGIYHIFYSAHPFSFFFVLKNSYYLAMEQTIFIYKYLSTNPVSNLVDFIITGHRRKKKKFANKQAP